MDIGRRAQSSVEYVVSYGWAILVILFIGIVLWQMGVFDDRGNMISSTGFSKLKPQLAASGLTAQGNLSAVLSNGAGGKVVIKGVTVTDKSTSTVVCCSHDTLPGCNGLGSSVNIAGKNRGEFMAGQFPKVNAGDSFLLNIDGCNVPSASSGATYIVQIDINYETISGKETVPHGDSGTIRNVFE